jgi:sulfur carrier protein
VIEVLVNGEPVELEPGGTVRDAALAAGIDPERRGVAVALEGEVVPRSEIGRTEPRSGQSIEVVAAIGGGA